MDQLIQLTNAYGLQVVLGAVGLGIIGNGMGTTMGVIGYRHGGDVTRGVWIGMILLFVIHVFAAVLANKTGSQIWRDVTEAASSRKLVRLFLASSCVTAARARQQVLGIR